MNEYLLVCSHQIFINLSKRNMCKCPAIFFIFYLIIYFFITIYLFSLWAVNLVSKKKIIVYLYIINLDYMLTVVQQINAEKRMLLGDRCQIKCPNIPLKRKCSVKNNQHDLKIRRTGALVTGATVALTCSGDVSLKKAICVYFNVKEDGGIIGMLYIQRYEVLNVSCAS